MSSLVSDWYAEKSVLITGATGFIGKVLLEKLLRSCSGIKIIYILVRSKKEEDVQKRKSDLFKNSLFEEIRTENPELLDKIVAIEGDLSEQDLGLKSEDKSVLIQNVSIIFHSAANVKFNEDLKSAVKANVLGTLQVCKLGLQIKNLQSFIYISTAFSNCNRLEIEEKLYNAPISIQDLFQLLNILDDETFRFLEPKLIKNWPNTYTFTKALTEHLLFEQFGRLPIAIIRPSIVTASLSEPFPGWVDNITGITGIILAFSKGIVRSLLAIPDQICDFIPVDIVVNLSICASWFISNSRTKSIPIFNCTTGMSNPITCKDIQNYSNKWLHKYPYLSTIWYPGGKYTSNKFIHNFRSIIFRKLPAYLFDIILFLFKKKTKWIKLCSKIDTFLNVNSYFTLREWKFETNNMIVLLNNLSDTDRLLFNFNVKSIDYDDYFKNYILGIRKYILDEKLEDLPNAKLHFKRLKYLHYFTIFTLFIIILIILVIFINYLFVI